VPDNVLHLTLFSFPNLARKRRFCVLGMLTELLSDILLDAGALLLNLGFL
jgi:hypothetical protein